MAPGQNYTGVVQKKDLIINEKCCQLQLEKAISSA